MNPVGLLSLILPLLAGSPFRGKLDLSDRTDFRAGYFGFPTDPSAHAETVPTARLLWGSRSVGITAEYAPRIGLADIQDGFNLSVLNVGLLSAEWRTEMTRLTLSEYASYGFLNYSAQQLPGPTTTGGIRLDPLLRQKLLYEASSTSLSAVITPEKRWSVSVAVSYSLSGGADDEARSVLPFVKGPLIAATFDYGLGKSDRLITGASGEHSNLSTGFDYYFLRASEGWTHEFASRSSITLGAGLTAVRSSSFTPTVPLFIAPTLIDGTHYDLYPTVDAALLYQLPFRDKATLRARSALAPVINRATGLLSQQVLALVNASWFETPWIVLADAGLSQSLEGGADAYTYVSGQVAGGYWITKNLDISAGAKAAWQKVGQFSSPIVERLAFVAVTVRLPSLRF